MLVSSYISPKARKGRPSAMEGRGLVAVAPIAKDEHVAIKGSHIVDTPTLHSLPERLRNSDVQIADGFHLAARRRAATTCGATTGGMISPLFRPRTALPAQAGEITTANGATSPS